MPTPLEIFQDKERFIDKSVKAIDSDISVIQAELLSQILSDYIDEFTLDDDGNIKSTKANILKAAAIDKVVDDWSVKHQQSVLKDYTKRVLSLAGMNKDYFIALDKTKRKEVLAALPELEAQINATIGIRKIKRDGKLVTEIVKGGYLDTLARSNEIKTELKSYVLQSVNANTSLKDYQRGFANILQKDNGIVDKHYKTFVYDTFNQIDRIESTFYAERLGLTKFIYQGSLIDSSRPFCCKRAGKVFDSDDVDSWKCDVNLLGKPTGKKCDQSYRPLVELGRWNCRHGLRYISDELADRMGVTKSKDIINRQGGQDCPDKK